MGQAARRWAFATVALGLACPLVLTGPASASLTRFRQPPAPTGRATELYGVSALSPSDAWTVGFNTPTHESLDTTLVEHWDGTAWTQVASPSPPGASELYGVSAAAADDVWAVGDTAGQSSMTALIEHWDGTAWTEVASPAPGRAHLVGVDAVSPSDVWAVGDTNAQTSGKSLIEHWDGSRWTRVPSPSPGGKSGTVLSDVTGVSGVDAWAVGTYGTKTGYRTLVAHWDGTSWSQVASPDPGGAHVSHFFESVSAVSAGDVWAVGTSFTGSGFVEAGFVDHWDGKRWRTVPSVQLKSGFYLSSVSADSATDAWAIGSSFLLHGLKTFTEHWDGHAWTRVASPSPGKSPDLEGVSATSPGEAWAVGGDVNRATTATIVEHWDGTAWTVS